MSAVKWGTPVVGDDNLTGGVILEELPDELILRPVETKQAGKAKTVAVPTEDITVDTLDFA